MQIQKVDTEITGADTSLDSLRKKEKTLMDVAAAAKQQKEKAYAAKKKAEADAEDDAANSWRTQTLAQKIYMANRKTAAAQHSILDSCGERYMLPLYNQPLDVEHLTTLLQRHQTAVKGPLLEHIRKIKNDRWLHHTKLVETYAQMSTEWQKRVDKSEASAKRKAREAKNREFFEKVFTELRKQREDKERFNRVGSRIKSEADYEEIMDGLQEQAMEVRKMRSYAIIPPLMYDAQQRKCVYHNENGLVEDMVAVHKERGTLNVWTAGEKDLFKEKFLQHPKNFGAIAASLDRKSAQDCVRYYYLSKKTENYKQLLRKSRQRTRASKTLQKTQQQQTQCIIDSLTTGVTTRLQREQQQKTGGRSAAAERERERAEREKAAEKAAAEAAKAAANASKAAAKQETNAETVSTTNAETATSLSDATKATTTSSSDKATTSTSSSVTSSTASSTTSTATNSANTSKSVADNTASSELSADTTTTTGTGTAPKAKTPELLTTADADTKSEREEDSKEDTKSNETTASTKVSGAEIVSTDVASTTSTASSSATSTKTDDSTTGSTVAMSSSPSSTVVSNTNLNHPPLSTPNGVKTCYAAAMAAQIGAATPEITSSSNATSTTAITTADNEQSKTSATGNDKSKPSSTDPSSGAGGPQDTSNLRSCTSNNVTTPTTSTTAGNFLGQKLKVAQVESLMGTAGATTNNDCNSDVRSVYSI